MPSPTFRKQESAGEAAIKKRTQWAKTTKESNKVSKRDSFERMRTKTRSFQLVHRHRSCES